MRILDAAHVDHVIHSVDATGEDTGVDIAHRAGEDPDHVFKTLVTQGKSGEHLVFMVEDAPAVNEAFKDLEKTTRASAQHAEKELSQMRERVKDEPIAEKAVHAREASSRMEAARGKPREMSRGVETRAK